MPRLTSPLQRQHTRWARSMRWVGRRVCTHWSSEERQRHIDFFISELLIWAGFCLQVHKRLSLFPEDPLSFTLEYTLLFTSFSHLASVHFLSFCLQYQNGFAVGQEQLFNFHGVLRYLIYVSGGRGDSPTVSRWTPISRQSRAFHHSLDPSNNTEYMALVIVRAGWLQESEQRGLFSQGAHTQLFHMWLHKIHFTVVFTAGETFQTVLLRKLQTSVTIFKW